ncbi:LOW QUALITY PROTEIN: uncharacterized protein LOC127245191 [Andrographis paniculata]|uniref:LOW QUALITY PROTEIN: uncharacterized protein LOC127245191 n=1 Tax=Andrographis paniculata TaxID=175694 RepID=UPI0021E75C06|nr:LOW QUALITY PROTEIN: uncharacterized protein LOC127245191 [Andrographis paniculata]
MRRKIGSIKPVNLVRFVCLIISFTFIVIQIYSALQLGSISSETSSAELKLLPNTRTSSSSEFGETVIKMLPEDLKFTMFLPSEESFRRDLRLNMNDSNSYAVLTRVLGFSAVPRWITLAELEYGKEKCFQTISGFNLYVSKDSTGMVVVNGVVSNQVGLKMKDLMVHIMDGVVMDAEFEQSMSLKNTILEDEDDDVILTRLVLSI